MNDRLTQTEVLMHRLEAKLSTAVRPELIDRINRMLGDAHQQRVTAAIRRIEAKKAERRNPEKQEQ